MLNKILSVLIIRVFLFTISGCVAQSFVVGNGAKGNHVEDARQWYILYGLVPINKIDTNEMAKGSNDYTINTENSFVDIIISAVAGIVTVSCRSVSVTK